MNALDAALSPLRVLFGTRITITWPAPRTWPDGWEPALRAAARGADLSTERLVVENDKVVATFRNEGRRASLGSRINDLALTGAEQMAVPEERRRLISLDVYSPLVLLKSMVVAAIVVTVIGLLVAAVWGAISWWRDNPSTGRSVAVFGPLALIGFGILVAFISSSETDIRRPFERTQAELQRRRRSQPSGDRAEVQHPVGTDPAFLEAESLLLEHERVSLDSLQVRTRAIRDDRDLLRDRAQSAYRLACLFLLLALGGPVFAGWLLFSRGDWHFLLASLSIAAVPLAIGLALLRHDTKLREQHGEAEAQLEVLDRLNLALEYARTAGKEVYSETLRQVIAALLKPTDRQLVHSTKQGKKPAKERIEDSEASNAVAVLEKMGDTVAKVGDSVSKILPKGS